MSTTSDFRNMYTSAYSRKSPARDTLEKRYMDVISRINSAYRAAEADIEREYNNYFNAASAQNSIAKKNTAEMMAQKGLSRSGESVQNAILHDMSLANTMTQLSEQKAEKIAQNNKKRMLETAAVEKELIEAQNEADYRDREFEYQKERDEIKDRQWKEEFDYNSSRASISDYKWEKEQERQKARDAESDRQWNVSHAYKREQDAIANDRKERELAREIYENDRDYQLSRDKFEAQNLLDREELELKKTTAANENYIKSQYLAMEKQEKAAKAAKEAEKEETTDKNGITYTSDGDGNYTPKMSANELINLIERKSQYGIWDEEKGYISPRTLLKNRFMEVIGNPNLNEKYREDLIFLGTARGILE
ncbi:MAG: hypothetical protein IJO52_10170 [Clostridia bacterium]|nr:hypothetical protein [Clostridia bacterium]